MKTIYRIVLMLICLGFAIGLNVFLPKPTKPALIMSQAQRSPGSPTLKLSTFEYAHGAAELLWLDIVQQVGAIIENKSQDGLTRVAEGAHFTVDLDKGFFNAYYVPSILLSVYGNKVAESDKLATKGYKALPKRWEFPFMLGWNNYFLRQNALAAANNWKEASQLNEAPRFLGSLSGRAMAQATNPKQALVFLAELLQNLPIGPRRNMVIERMKLLRGEIILNAYDKACKQYLEDYDDKPLSATLLFNTSLDLYEPKDGFGAPIYLDFKEGRCIARSKNNKVRDFEAFARVQKSSANAPFN